MKSQRKILSLLLTLALIMSFIPNILVSAADVAVADSTYVVDNMKYYNGTQLTNSISDLTHVSVDITERIPVEEYDYLIIAAYASDGTFLGMNYSFENFDFAKTKSVNLPINITSGKTISEVRAFVWKSFSQMTPLSNIISSNANTIIEPKIEYTTAIFNAMNPRTGKIILLDSDIGATGFTLDEDDPDLIFHIYLNGEEIETEDLRQGDILSIAYDITAGPTAKIAFTYSKYYEIYVTRTVQPDDSEDPVEPEDPDNPQFPENISSYNEDTRFAVVTKAGCYEEIDPETGDVIYCIEAMYGDSTELIVSGEVDTDKLEALNPSDVIYFKTNAKNQITDFDVLFSFDGSVPTQYNLATNSLVPNNTNYENLNGITIYGKSGTGNFSDKFTTDWDADRFNSIKYIYGPVLERGDNYIVFGKTDANNKTHTYYNTKEFYVSNDVNVYTYDYYMSKDYRFDFSGPSIWSVVPTAITASDDTIDWNDDFNRESVTFAFAVVVDNEVVDILAFLWK